MSRKLPLIEYEIVGEGIHCEADIYVADIKIGTIDTGTKYSERAEMEIAEVIKKAIFGKMVEKCELYDTDDEEY